MTMQKLNIPDRFTGKIYFYVVADPKSCLYGEIFVTNCDPTDWPNQISVGQLDVDVALDSQGSTDKQIAMLRQARKQVVMDAVAKAKEIDEAIQSLLAIEHKDHGDEEA